MAWIRLEPQQGMVDGRRQYDGICEENDDLEAVEESGYAEFNEAHVELGVGSLAFCLEDGKLYVLAADGTYGEWVPTSLEE